jgi:hypothetical protein
MSTNQRLGLLALVVVVAVGAFVIVKPGGNGDSKNTSSTGTSSSTSPSKPAAPAVPTVQKVQIKDGKPVGGVQGLKFKKGDEAQIVVSVDKQHLLHLHGYDIEKTATPSKPATFKFKASNEGQFELESHTNEHEGLEPVVARVLVEPS